MSTMSAATATRWLTAQQQGHWRAYVDGAALLNEALARELERDAELSLSEYEILVRLSEAPDRTLRMSSLADELAHSRSRITHTIRGVNAAMTALGFARLEAAAPGHVEAVRTNLVDLLTEEQLRALGESMAAVRDALRGAELAR